MQKQTYSCGNDPQPGDVVEVVTMDDLPEESWANQAVREKLQKGNNYSVFAAAFGDWICLFNKPEIIWHHPSRFRLLRRAGEQPDYAKMLEEKDEAIRELVKGLRYIEEKNYPNNTPDNYIRNYKNHTKSSLLTLPLSGIKNLLCDVSQLIAGWNATDSEWSDWDEGVRKRVSELQNKIDVYGNVLFAQDYESPIRENT